MTELKSTLYEEVEPLKDGLEHEKHARSFTTEKGSVYTRNDDSRWSRYKTVAGEHYGPQEITVFAIVSDLDMGVISDLTYCPSDPTRMPYAMTREELDRSFLLLEERDEAGSIKHPTSLDDVEISGNLVLTRHYDSPDGIVVRGQMPVSLEPTLGAVPVEFRKVQDMTMPDHLGHRVTEVRY